jgi:hypothetical protein
LETEVTDSVDNADDGAGIEVAGPGMANNLSTDTIFLGSERESDESDTVEVGEVATERIKAIVAYEELDVTETKRVAFSGTAILARAKEPKECHVTQVGDGKTDVIAVEGGHLTNIVEDTKR